MIRLTLILCVVLYAGLVIYSQVATQDVESAPSTPAPAPAIVPTEPSTSAVSTGTDGLVTLTTAEGEVIVIDAVITPSGLDENRTVQVNPDTSGAAVTPSPSALPDAGPLLRVTGNSVNLRASPSTDANVLAALVRDTQAVLLEEAANGWLRIRIVGSGLEGYMSGDFLAAVAD